MARLRAFSKTVGYNWAFFAQTIIVRRCNRRNDHAVFRQIFAVT